MKNLLYKELKLSFHPMIWIFIFAFPLMILIPSYPLYVCFIYTCSCYPILFLGANKGQSSNDIFYTCLLPIRKKDVVKARLLSVMFIQLIPFIIMAILSPISLQYKATTLPEFLLTEEEIAAGLTNEYVGMDGRSLLSAYAFTLISYSLYDLFYFSFFYKDGRQIMIPTLFGLLVFIAILTVFTVILPTTNPWFYHTFCECSMFAQLGYFAIGLVIYALLHYLTYDIASKELEKVDF